MKPEDIHDIKGLFAFVNWFKIALIGLAVALAIGLAVWWWRRKRTAAPKPRPPSKPPWQIALEELDALRQNPHPADSPKVFHFRLSEIIRFYFEARFGFPATDRTGEEIREALLSLPNLTPDQKQAFLKLLQETDLVKFTDTGRTESQNLALLELARHFVQETKPELPGGGT